MANKKCTEVKVLEDFHRDCKTQDGRMSRCKQCRISETKEYRDSNRDTIRHRDVEFYYNNRLRRLALSKSNAPKYLKGRRSKDPVYVVKHAFSVIIRATLAGRREYTRKSKYYRHIGLDFRDLINYLHSTFEFNYGLPRECIKLSDVEIDHIIPLSTAKTLEDVRRLNHYTNLQLLFKEDNQAKGTKLTLDLSPDLV